MPDLCNLNTAFVVLAPWLGEVLVCYIILYAYFGTHREQLEESNKSELLLRHRHGLETKIMLDPQQQSNPPLESGPQILLKHIHLHYVYFQPDQQLPPPALPPDLGFQDTVQGWLD